MTQEIIQAFILIFIAEMGDKTQILAMAFATRYPVKKVLCGIFLGCLLNHGLAVALGTYISTFLPIATIQIVAGLAFIGFSLWTLKAEDEEDEEEEQKVKFGPVLTVALAFFIGELGDKTQLTAITLGSSASYPLAILAGTVLGMTVTGAMGIFIGKKLGDKIPEFGIKIMAASIFMFFGLTKLYEYVPNQYVRGPYMIVFVAGVFATAAILLHTLLKKRKEGIRSAYIAKSKALYDYYNHLQKDMENICLGVENCKTCQGNGCVVGYTKNIIQTGLEGVQKENEGSYKPFVLKEQAKNKEFSQEEVIDSLMDTLKVLKDNPAKSEYLPLHQIRKQLELLLLKESIQTMNDFTSYKKDFEAINPKLAKDVFYKLSQTY